MSLQRIARSVAKNTLILIGAAAAGVLIAATTEAGAADRIPDPRPVPTPKPASTAPAHCSIEYLLAPGERSVEACAWKAGPLMGVVTIQSRHEAVDASLITITGRANNRAVISLTNRSTSPVLATAVVEVH